MQLKDGETIVFAGDSVTDCGRKRPVGEGLWEGVGNGYVRQIDNILGVAYPEMLFRIINAGISGNTSRDLLARFESDVLALNPSRAVILIGINDVWRQFDMPEMPEYHVYPDDYRKNMTEMIEKAKKCAKGVFVCTPYIMEPEKGDKMRKRMDEYTQICKELAEKYDCVLVDFQNMYDKFFAYRHSAVIAWDRIHPNQVGATLMAKEFLSKCGFDYNREI